MTISYELWKAIRMRVAVKMRDEAQREVAEAQRKLDRAQQWVDDLEHDRDHRSFPVRSL